ncbi:MAG TPA: DUF3231 family protein [Bacilli bacterium]
MEKKPSTEHKIKFTSAEIANLWTSYMNDSMAICTVGSFLKHVEDIEIRSVLELSMQLSQAHIKKLESFFLEENLPIPDGFSEEVDVNQDTPRLFTDDFYIFYIQNVGKGGLVTYSLALSNSSRLDLCEFFTECLIESTKLFNKTTEIMLEKGNFIRAPYIPDPHKVEYVHKQSYLAGLLGPQRPLNVVEISNIYFNLIQNQLGRSLIMGFSQVAESKQVRDFFVRGRNISDKHVEVFGSILSKEYLPSASSWSTLPTDSTIAPFSDKLMMFQVLALNAAGIGNYGVGIGFSARSDMGATYVRLVAEIMKFTEDGANIMIENGWLEEPPHAVDRDKLAEVR